MKIRNINLIAFGKFKNQRYDFSGDKINLVFGDNEAGKSTLFESFKTLLCGFTPANRDRYPYVPWGEDEASLELETFGGELVQRRLRSNVQGFYKGPATSEKIQNKPLFDLDRNLLESLYTLESDDLLDIDKRSMEYVFDELSTTFDIPGMLSPKAALVQLENQRKELYTKHAHSNRPLNIIEMELEELRGQLVDLEESAERYRKDVAEFGRTEQTSLELAAEIESIKEQIDRIHHLESKKDDWDQLKKARQAIHQETLSRSLGREFIQRFREIAFDVDNYTEQLRSRRHRLQQLEREVDRLNDTENEFLTIFDDYATQLQRGEADIERWNQNLEDASKNKAEQHIQFQTLSNRNFITRPDYSSFEYISLNRTKPFWLAPAILVVLLGAIGFAVERFHRSAFYLGRNIALSAGIIGLILLLYFLYQAFAYGRQRSHFGLSRGYNARELGDMAQLAKGLRQIDDLINTAKIRLEELKQEQNDALNRFGFSTIDAVFLRERELFRKQDRQDQKLDQVRATEREIEAVQEKLDYQRELKAEQIRPLKAYADDPVRAIELLQADLQAIDFFDELQRQWDESSVSPGDLETLENLPLAELNQTENALQERFRDTISKSAAARERMRQYEKLKPMEEYRNEIHSLEQRRKDVLYEYNSLLILQDILNEHYRQFIETHQPQLLDIASDYLKDFTSNRYHQILTIEQEFYLKKANGELVKLAASHSKGIRSQLYLALRLAIIDTVEKHQPLPLFFDEAFSNWDNPRLKRTLAVLREIAKSRQVFIFTCREEDAAMIEATADCYRIDL